MIKILKRCNTINAKSNYIFRRVEKWKNKEIETITTITTTKTITEMTTTETITTRIKRIKEMTKKKNN